MLPTDDGLNDILALRLTFVNVEFDNQWLFPEQSDTAALSRRRQHDIICVIRAGYSGKPVG